MKMGYVQAKEFSCLMMVLIMKETGKMTICPVMVDSLSQVLTMKAISETDLHMGRAIMRTTRKPIQESGEMI